MDPVKIELPYQWTQREDQEALWLYLEKALSQQTHELKTLKKVVSHGGRAVEVAHRQYGKDTIAMHFIAVASQQRVGNYVHMLPMKEQCRIAVWDSINPKTGKLRIDEAFPLEIRKSTDQTKMKIEFKPPIIDGVLQPHGSTYQLVGSDNYNSLMSMMFVGIVLSEWALANPMAWAYLGPIVEAHKAFALFISTSRGRNHLKNIYDFAKTEPGWYAGMHKASDTPVFTKEQLETIRRGYHAQFGEETGEALYQQEYFCSFEGAILGSYYSKQMAAAHVEKRIGVVPYQPSLEVYTYWDIGVRDANSIWFIQHLPGGNHHVIDYYEKTGMGMDHYAKVLKEKGYNYALHTMPHDADARKMTEGEFAKSPKELAELAGIHPVKTVPRVQNMDIVVMSHIPAIRNLLANCWFDGVKCAQGINALEAYHSEYSEDKKILSNRPEHDWSSNGADAFRTFAVGYAPKKKADESVSSMMRRRG
jgi:hypothetical protein